MKLLLLFFTTSTILLASNGAQVLFVRGKVTKLLPRQHKAKQVKKGDVLPEKTSLLTQKGSVVRIRFTDKSTVNLGPSSKIVISDLPRNQASVINLLTGAIKANVNKNNNNNEKMFVKTANAVMGVRGTKFQSTFNHVNQNTSLVTVEGNVAMAKTNKKTMSNSVEEITSSFNEVEPVEVRAGKFSGVKTAVEKPSVPVKIAPKQYDQLAKSMNSKKKAADVMKTSDAEKEVSKHLSKGNSKQLALKPGGYIDMETGIYVPPKKDAIIDSKTGTFKATNDIGSISKSGNYIAPRGIKLDAKKGFILDDKQVEVASNKTKAMLEDLNNETSEQLTSTKLKSSSSSWGPKTHIIGLHYSPYAETLRSEDGTNFSTTNGNTIILSYKQQWTDSFQTGMSFGGRQWILDKESNDTEDRESGDDNGTFILDLNFQVSDKFNIGLYYLEESLSIPTESQSSYSRYIIYEDNYKALAPHISYWLGTNGKLRFDIRADLKFYFDKDLEVENSGTSGDSVKISTNAFKFALKTSYPISKKVMINTDLFFEGMRHDIDNGDNRIDRDDTGARIGFSWSL